MSARAQAVEETTDPAIVEDRFLLWEPMPADRDTKGPLGGPANHREANPTDKETRLVRGKPSGTHS
jgi:hypothetical protein